MESGSEAVRQNRGGRADTADSQAGQNHRQRGVYREVEVVVN